MTLQRIINPGTDVTFLTPYAQAGIKRSIQRGGVLGAFSARICCAASVATNVVDATGQVTLGGIKLTVALALKVLEGLNSVRCAFAGSRPINLNSVSWLSHHTFEEGVFHVVKGCMEALAAPVSALGIIAPSLTLATNRLLGYAHAEPEKGWLNRFLMSDWSTLDSSRCLDLLKDGTAWAYQKGSENPRNVMAAVGAITLLWGGHRIATSLFA